MKINCFAASYSITLYWDKPDTANKNTIYEIGVNGIKSGGTTKTHYTVCNLKSEQKYSIEVKTDFEKSSVDIATNKQKCKPDVTKSPYFALEDGKALNTMALKMR